MRRLTKRLLRILCVLALVGGSMMSAAASVAAATPCAHEHGDEPGPQPHKHYGAGCLSCCLGACTAIPDLPSRTFLGVAPFTATPVSYWEIRVFLSGRSIAPDPAPPRISA
jgi:hypothetical protein